jgi:hypothetical protein
MHPKKEEIVRNKDVFRKEEKGLMESGNDNYLRIKF